MALSDLWGDFTNLFSGGGGGGSGGMFLPGTDTPMSGGFAQGSFADPSSPANMFLPGTDTPMSGGLGLGSYADPSQAGGGSLWDKIAKGLGSPAFKEATKDFAQVGQGQLLGHPPPATPPHMPSGGYMLSPYAQFARFNRPLDPKLALRQFQTGGYA